MSSAISRRHVLAAPLDSLTAFDPLTLQPAAVLATYYHVDAEPFRYAWIDTNWRPQ